MSKDHLQKDKWLSRLLKKSAYNFYLNKTDGSQIIELWNNFYQKIEPKDIFVTCKVNVDKHDHINSLIEVGFKLIDTSIQLSTKNILPNTYSGNSIVVRFAKENDESDISLLAKKNFIYSRFHLDQSIKNNVANNIKSEWTKSYFKGNRGNEMIVASINSKIIGFLQIIQGDENFIIDLIGVDDEMRRMGIATSMISFASTKLNPKQVFVGTQLINRPSIAAYENMGFKFFDSKYIFHFHS